MSKNVVVLDEVDFKKAIDEINIRIQAIDEYLGTDDVTKLSEQFVMRLPKKYIRTASHFKEKLAFIDNEVLRKNISYHFQLSDLNSFMLNRMHVWGVVRNLVVKFQVVNMGAIAEAILVSVTPKKCKTKNLRIAFLIEGNHISEELKSEIDWLWSIRNGVHIHEINQSEIGAYTDEMFDRSMSAVKGLIEAVVQMKN
jgi:hypothetical protein